jgi:hypothetical protein
MCQELAKQTVIVGVAQRNFTVVILGLMQVLTQIENQLPHEGRCGKAQNETPGVVPQVFPQAVLRPVLRPVLHFSTHILRRIL